MKEKSPDENNYHSVGKIKEKYLKDAIAEIREGNWENIADWKL